MYQRILSSSTITPAERLSALLNHSYTSLLNDLPGTAYRDLCAIDELAKEGVKLDTKQQAKHVARFREAAGKLNIDPVSGKTIEAADSASYPAEFRFNGQSWGLYAKRDIELGEIVRPMGYILVSSDRGDSKWQFWFRPDADKQSRTTAQIFAVCRAVHDLVDDPRKAEAWAALHPRQDTHGQHEYSIKRELASQIAISAADLGDKFARNSGGKHNAGSTRLDMYGRESGDAELDPIYSKTNHCCVPNIQNMPIEGDPDERKVCLTDMNSSQKSAAR